VVTVIVIVAVVLVAGGVALAAALARKGRRQYLDQGTAPGLAENAPREWAGAHSPEAKLHRRLVASSKALSSQELGDAATIGERVAIEQQILQLDQQLVALSAAPGPDTAAALTEVETMVTSVEKSVSQLATAGLENLRRNQSELGPGESA
jgi:hypothetical protein